MKTNIFSEVGLSQNEAKIYNTLLIEGELQISEIAKKTSIHRRNVYDSMNRLIDKQLVLEIFNESSSIYQAAHPQKLEEIMENKHNAFNKEIHRLHELHQTSPNHVSCQIFKGVGGARKFFSNSESLHEAVYVFSSQAVWLSSNLGTLGEKVQENFFNKNSKSKIIFSKAVIEKIPQLKNIEAQHRFMQREPEVQSVIYIFEKRVAVFTDVESAKILDNSKIFSIESAEVAQIHRAWFESIWESSPVL